MPYWSPLVIDGHIVDLAHLEPFEFQVIPSHFDIEATIRVRFHDHCFTETFDPDRHRRELMIEGSSQHEARVFAKDRYELSFRLPGIIRNLDGKRIASTREGNLVKVTLADGRLYPVFFTLRKEAGNRVGMFVVSAYEWTRSGKPASTGEMKFNVAIMKILKGERLRFP